jgi:hypothetical protein
VPALVIATMSPDFEYLVRTMPRSQFGHTLAGGFTFCVPMSLAAWLLYRWLVSPLSRELLPTAMGHAIQRRHRRLDLPALGWATLATVLGAFSHLAWDAFTHHDGLVVAATPILRAAVPSTGGSLRWYQVGQHGSTLLGLVVLFLWAQQAWTSFPPEARRFGVGQAKRVRSRVAILLALSAAGTVLNGRRAWGGGVIPVLAFAAVGAMDGAALALFGLGVVARLRGGHSTA